MSLAATRGLADLLWREGAADQAAVYYEEALQHLAASAAERSAVGDALLAEMATRAGEARLAGSSPEAALRVLVLGQRLSGSEATLRLRAALAEAALQCGDAEYARSLFRELLESAARGPDARRYEWALGLARATLAAGDKEDAQRAFRRAADEAGADDRALAAVETLLTESERWEELEETLKEHLDSTRPPERAPLYARLGDLRFAHLHDLGGAADAYTLALEASKGADRNLLHRLMVVFSEAREWAKLQDVVLAIAEQVDDPVTQAKYFVTAAVIAHDALDQLGIATVHYSAALERDPSSLSAHEGLVRALDSAQRWDALEEECERRAAHADAAEQASLLVLSARVRRHVHEDVAGAVERLERACALAPGRRDVLVALAEAYAESDAPLHAAPIHQTLIKLDPFRVDSYRALGAVHTPDQEADRSMLVCSVLSALGEATSDERVCYDFLHDASIARAKTPVTQELFDAYIRHPSQDVLLTALIERIEPVIWISRRHRAADYGLLPEDQSAIGRDSSNAVRTLRAAAQTFALPMPEVYWRPREPGCLSTLIFEVPAVGLGRSALTHVADQELAFLCARQVALLRPGHGVREVVANADDLKAWVLAAITLAHRDFVVPDGLSADVDIRREKLGVYLSKAQRADLSARVDDLLASTPQLDLNRYLAAVELGADRMGLLLANDVVVAKHVIEHAPSDLVAQRERLGDLLGYSASDDYVELRRALGIGVA
jgi:tetratricopeptide (TPR) repeat protein